MQYSSSETQPLISVIIPCFNYGRYLGEAVQSVLDQSHGNTEIVIVDDGSTDNTRSVAKAFGARVNYVHQENQGIGAARNLGVTTACGSLLSFLDADDCWTAHKLSRQLAVLEGADGVEIVFGKARQYYSPEVSEQFRRTKGYKQEIMNAPLATAMLLTRESFMKVGFYTTQRVAIDQEWYMRALDLGLRMHTIDEVVYLRRIHENNNGVVAEPAGGLNRLHLLKQALDRRRQHRQ